FGDPLPPGGTYRPALAFLGSAVGFRLGAIKHGPQFADLFVDPPLLGFEAFDGGGDDLGRWLVRHDCSPVEPNCILCRKPGLIPVTRARNVPIRLLRPPNVRSATVDPPPATSSHDSLSPGSRTAADSRPPPVDAPASSHPGVMAPDPYV